MPETVTVVSAKSLAMGDTAKTGKLTITGYAPFSGPVRIIFTSANRISRTHLAEYSIAMGDRSSDRWLAP